jgi:periplasmic protein TonB
MADHELLSECLVDSDADARARAQRLRQKALIASVAIEAVLIAAMLLWPLITPGVLPRQYVVTPAPPYGGGTRAHHADSHPGRRSHPSHQPEPILLEPPTIPHHAQLSPGNEAPELNAAGGPPGTEGPGEGPGPLIPGGSDKGPPIPEIRRPQPTRPAAPQHVSEGVMQAALLYKVQPEYPALARSAHLAGTVRLRAIIGTDGRVRQVEVLSGNPLLASAALTAVYQWRYRPTRLSGEAIEVETLITVNFVLQ